MNWIRWLLIVNHGYYCINSTGKDNSNSNNIVGTAKYDVNIGPGKGNCNYETVLPIGFASLGPKVFSDSAACGQCLEVKHKNHGQKLKVMVMDICVGCAANDMMLDYNTYTQLGDTLKGSIPVEWNMITCPTKGSVKYQFFPNSSRYWFGIGIRNAAIPVVKLEIFGDFGWTSIPRSNFNYFILSDPGPGPYKLRATSKFGESIVEDGVPLLNGTLYEGKAQFRNGTLDSTTAYDSLVESDMN